MGKQERMRYSQMAAADKKRYEKELQGWQAMHGKSLDDEEDKEADLEI